RQHPPRKDCQRRRRRDFQSGMCIATIIPSLAKLHNFTFGEAYVDIYLIRHARAVALGEQGIETDEDRPLTEDGVIQARQLADTLQKHGVELDAILTTPLLRARRTAEILLENWHGQPAPELIVESRLTP